jgi:hypothetical protein
MYLTYCVPLVGIRGNCFLLRIYTKKFTVFLSKKKDGLTRNLLVSEMFSVPNNAEQNPLSSYS